MKKSAIFILALLITACGTTANAPAVDPNVSLAIAQAQLTSTSQALEIQIIGWTATAQSWTPTPSLTPVPTSTPTITFTPTVNATGTMLVERMNAEIADMRREATRKEATNQVLAWMPYVVMAFAVGLALFIGYVAAKRLAMVPTPIHDGTGKPMPMLNVIDGVLMDADRMTNGAGILTKAFVKSLPLITAERQDATTSRAQMVDMKSRTKITTAAVTKLLETNGLDKAMPATAAQLTAPVVTEDDNNMPLPPWEFIGQWDGTSKPLGFGKAGLITAKAASPHILISGKTGSGKTIYMMRTLTATSLAKGSQVVNIGYSNAGYGVFERHVNFHNVQLPDPRYVIECLAQVYDELKERKALIGGDMVEWEYWPGGQPPRPFLDVMLDELGNMAEDIYTGHGPALTKELWSYISRIANEGRKVGIRFVAALQDPTSKSMDLRFRRNCTLVAFRQGDMDQSRAFLGTSGAEQLNVGHFMASLDSLVIGGGFSPTDAEILDYLAKSPVQPAEKPKWIDGVTRPADGNQLPVREEPLQIIEPTATESLPAKPIDEIAEMAERIRAQWSPTMTKSAVSRLLGKEFEGTSWTAKVNRVIAYLTSTTPPTTTEKQPEMGSLAPEMA